MFDVFLKFLSLVVKSGLIIFQLSPLSSDWNKWLDPKNTLFELFDEIIKGLLQLNLNWGGSNGLSGLSLKNQCSPGSMV